MSGSIPESADTCLGGGLGVLRAEVGVGARERGVGAAEGTVNRVTAVLALGFCDGHEEGLAVFGLMKASQGSRNGGTSSFSSIPAWRANLLPVDGRGEASCPRVCRLHLVPILNRSLVCLCTPCYPTPRIALSVRHYVLCVPSNALVHLMCQCQYVRRWALVTQVPKVKADPFDCQREF